MPVSRKRQLFNSITNFIIKTIKLNNARHLFCAFFEKIVPVYNVQLISGGHLTFYCPNELTLWRAKTLLTKEPETIAWIDSFSKNDILFDIGANVGLYSIYTGKKQIRVFAFEPESQNYAILNRNIYLNQIANKISAFNIAFSDKDEVEKLNLPKFMGGGAINSLGAPTDWQNQEFSPVFEQAVLSFSLDSFLKNYPQIFPNHIKIDVDGIEAKIVNGALKTLKDPRFKSLSIEINEESNKDLATVKLLQEQGLVQVSRKHSELFNEGKFKNVYNYLFRSASQNV